MCRRLPRTESPRRDLLEVVEYETFCDVTTEILVLGKPTKNTGNATCETWIEESKGQLAMGRIRAAEFLAYATLSTVRYAKSLQRAAKCGRPLLKNLFVNNITLIVRFDFT